MGDAELVGVLISVLVTTSQSEPLPSSRPGRAYAVVMPARRCLVCNELHAACGQPTEGRIVAIGENMSKREKGDPMSIKRYLVNGVLRNLDDKAAKQMGLDPDKDGTERVRSAGTVEEHYPDVFEHGEELPKDRKKREKREAEEAAAAAAQQPDVVVTPDPDETTTTSEETTVAETEEEAAARVKAEEEAEAQNKALSTPAAVPNHARRPRVNKSSNE